MVVTSVLFGAIHIGNASEALYSASYVVAQVRCSPTAAQPAAHCSRALQSLAARVRHCDQRLPAPPAPP